MTDFVINSAKNELLFCYCFHQKVAFLFSLRVSNFKLLKTKISINKSYSINLAFPPTISIFYLFNCCWFFLPRKL